MGHGRESFASSDLKTFLIGSARQAKQIQKLAPRSQITQAAPLSKWCLGKYSER